MSTANENIIDHMTFDRALIKLEQCLDSAMYRDQSFGLAIIGKSRKGKLTIAESFYSEHRPYEVSGNRKVPILRVVATPNLTIKNLVDHMLCQMGDRKFLHGTVNAKTIRLKKLIGFAETKMIMIDEFQNFVNKETRRGSYSATDWLKMLIDECGVSLVVLGPKSALSVLDQNEQLNSRFARPIKISRT